VLEKMVPRVVLMVMLSAASACTVEVSLEGKACAPQAPFCLAGYSCVAGVCRSGAAADGGDDAGVRPTIVGIFFTEADVVPPMTCAGVSWDAGDLVVVGYAAKSGNHPDFPFSTACSIGDAGCTLRNSLSEQNGAFPSVALWTYSPTVAAGNQTVSLAGSASGQQFGLLMVWVVRGVTTVLPAAPPQAMSDVSSRAFTTGQEDLGGVPQRDVGVLLVADAGTRPANGAVVLGMSSTYLHWTVLDGQGAPRSMLPGFTQDVQYSDDPYCPRALSFHSTSLHDGQSDFVAGTTSADALTFGNVVVLELR
jgi:hypothetical protein